MIKLIQLLSETKYIQTQGEKMTVIESITMGFIQGLTEFLPVSSSGHLALFKILFHVNTDTGALYTVLLHLATLVAIFAAFYQDIWKMICEGCSIIRDACRNIAIFFTNLFQHEDKPYYRLVSSAYRKFVMLVIVSTIPTAIIGFVDADMVEKAETILLVPGVCLVITGILLLISDHIEDRGKKPRHITYSNAFIIGICQGLATLPGLSRSGTTITACLLSGFDRKFAVKYSFIMSIPAVLGAGILKVGDIRSNPIASTEIGIYLAGMLVAAIVGYISIKTMLVIVRKKRFTFFGIYCLVIGAISIFGYYYAI